jgi:hypothetical protein
VTAIVLAEFTRDFTTLSPLLTTEQSSGRVLRWLRRFPETRTLP